MAVQGPIDQDAEFFHGLTAWGPNASYQVRDDCLAFHVMENAKRSSEQGQPVLMTLDEARRLRDLLNVATARGAL